jgi:hypothetical protein
LVELEAVWPPEIVGRITQEIRSFFNAEQSGAVEKGPLELSRGGEDEVVRGDGRRP